ncbi:MAG: GFA family protein, partial [Proteobacteria bacterium]|nr:GFA family protein [Pseudomonadota bacterium]
MAAREEPALRATGRCLCGAVRYQIRGPLRPVVNCHCGQCRRTHGNVAAYTSAARADLVLTEDRGLKWYRSSEVARRGFCRNCGASLFWERLGGDRVAVAAGGIDPPSGLKTIRHIFVADK